MSAAFPDPAPVLADLSRMIHGVSADETATFLREIASARRVYVAGAGRSGLMMRAFATRLMHLGKETHVIGDVTAPALARGDLLIIGSGSGRTESMVGIAARAQTAGARVALITSAILGPLAALAHFRVRMPPILPVDVLSAPQPGAAPEPSVFQPMRTLFEQALLVWLDLAVVALMDLLKVTPEMIEARHQNVE